MSTSRDRNHPAEGELRQLTVLACDMVDSTGIAERLDIEDYRNLMVTFRKTCAELIERYGGYVAREAGDGLQVYFGYPNAREDDARRAVRAALALVNAVSRITVAGDGGKPVQLQMRIGVHTGVVIAADIQTPASPETPRAEGVALHIAERLQRFAPSNGVVISDATFRLVEGFFVCGETKEVSLKGLSQLVKVHVILDESTVRTRFELSSAGGLSPLVGRDWQLALLCEYWKRTQNEGGQVVLVQGEAGIGKTRLLQAVQEEAMAGSDRWFECHCSSLTAGSALFPFIELFQDLLGTAHLESAEKKVSQIAARLAAWQMSDEKLLPAFSALLSLPASDHDLEHPSNPKRLKREIFEAMLAWFHMETTKAPLVLAIEDLHWADASTLEFLVVLLEQVPLSQAYVILTFRPEFHPPWSKTARYTQLVLDRLAKAHAEQVARWTAQRMALTDELLRRIVEDTDGVPLYIEECTKAMLDAGPLRRNAEEPQTDPTRRSVNLPGILRESLTARLDRLGVAKEVAQLASTVGRSFSYQLLLAVWDGSESDLRRGLDIMVEAELLFPHGLPPEASYVFKHTLIQEQAYETLLSSRRRFCHKRIAEALERSFPDIKASRPELIAQNLTAAGLHERSIEYWASAGKRAAERSAIIEAVAHYETGLKEAGQIEEEPRRQSEELALRNGLAPALIGRDGWASRKVEDNYERARQLCGAAGDAQDLFDVLRGLFNVYLLRGDLEKASQLIDQLHGIIERTEDLERRNALLLSVCRSEGGHGLFAGEFAAARERFDKVNSLYDRKRHRSQVFVYGTDPEVIQNSLGAWADWFLGFPEQARQKADMAISHAAELNHPFSMAYAHCLAASLHLFRRDYDAALIQSEQAIAIAEEQGHAYWVAYGDITRGAALGARQATRRGIAIMVRGFEAYRETGSRVLLPYFHALLAASYGRVGLLREGLDALDRNEAKEVRFYAAESLRIKGELVQMMEPGSPEPERCFRAALDLAGSQNAQALVLRSATSLSHCLIQQKHYTEAADLLSQATGAFTEGLEEADFLAARSILATLS